MSRSVKLLNPYTLTTRILKAVIYFQTWFKYWKSSIWWLSWPCTVHALIHHRYYRTCVLHTVTDNYMTVIAHVSFSLSELAIIGLTTDHIMLFDHFVHEITSSSTPRNRALPEKQAGPQLVKKFPTVYETLWFITAFTSAHHLSLL
jgi:hypothetical protein